MNKEVAVTEAEARFPTHGTGLFLWSRMQDLLLKPFDNPANHQDRWTAARHADRLISNWVWEVWNKQKALAAEKKLRGEFTRYKEFAVTRFAQDSAKIAGLDAEVITLKATLEASERQYKIMERRFGEQYTELVADFHALKREYESLKQHYDKIVLESEGEDARS